MRDDDGGGPRAVRVFNEDVENGLSGFCVKVPRGFVSQKAGGRADKRSRDRGALPFPARHFAGEVIKTFL